MSRKETCRPPSDAPPLPESFVAPESVRAGTVRKSKMGRKRAIVLLLVHVVIFIHLVHWQVAGKTISPLEPSEAMFTLTKGVVNAGAILFGLSLVLTLIFGRFFCGWACHVVALQDLCAWILKKVGIRPRPLRSRLLRFVPLLAALLMFCWAPIWNWFAGFERPEYTNGLLKADFWETFPGFWIGLLTFVVSGGVMIYLLGAKGFCTYACPYGGFFGVLDKLAPGRILVSDACRQCGHCTAVCTSNVQVHTEVRDFGQVMDSGCMKCLDCVSVCPEGALSFGFGTPSAFKKRRVRTKTKRPWSFRFGEEIVLVLLFSVSLLILRGLPPIATKGPPARVYEWAESLYGEIPGLLGLALATCAAFLGVLSIRALTRKEATFLGKPLRTEKGLAARGIVMLAATVIFWVFLAHSAVVQYHTFQGNRLSQLSEDYAQAAFHQESTALDKIPMEIQADFKEGARHYARATSLGIAPDSRVAIRLARLHMIERNLKGAEDSLRGVAIRPGASPNLRFALGHVLALEGKLYEGIEHLLHAAKEAPEIPEHREGLRRAAAALVQSGDLQATGQFLDHALAIYPDDELFATNRAFGLALEGRLEDAVTLLARAVPVAAACTRLADFLRDAGRTADADALMQRAKTAK